MTTRTSRAEWRGDLKGGEGELEVGDGVFRGAYTFASRFEEGEGTNPEELLGAAHAACFSMFLSGQLSGAGHEPESIRTEAVVHLEKVDGEQTITKVALQTRVRLADIDEDEFARLVDKSKVGCPVSRLFDAEITVDAELVD